MQALQANAPSFQSALERENEQKTKEPMTQAQPEKKNTPL
jgi:hypothetical protein